MSTVVIIEDDAIISKIYESKLRAEGNTVAVAADGRSGIELVKSMSPQLVLVDLMLPDISGIEVIRALRSNIKFANVPIIAYSGADENILSDAREANPTRVLSKTAMSARAIFENVKDLLEQTKNRQSSVYTDSPNTSVKDESENAAANPSGRVLIVEDELVSAAVVQDIVEKSGFETVVIHDGSEALRLLSKDSNFIMGIFDINLPKISGIDLLRYMRGEKRLMKIPVMIMTANESLRVQLDAQNAGSSVFIPKPLERASFLTLFSVLVGKKIEEPIDANQ